MEKHIIRQAKPEDYNRVVEIAVEAWSVRGMNYLLEKKYGIVGSKTKEERIEAEVRDFLTRNPENALVSEYEGKIVGFIFFSLDEDRKIGTIGYNAVDRKYQNRGIGTAQVTETLKIFREKGMRYAQVFTWLDEAHAPARRIYEKAGFGRLIEHCTYFREL